ncbi:hypothetical protein GCM10023175_04070 [Pseudonocardia xishanensis]|uniref:Uncharacterized protein n=1 Tax=Pseudonocardia xishanensis TaxID=630995 RepID=A0ABP8RFF7_9PSEU
MPKYSPVCRADTPSSEPNIEQSIRAPCPVRVARRTAARIAYAAYRPVTKSPTGTPHFTGSPSGSPVTLIIPGRRLHGDVERALLRVRPDVPVPGHRAVDDRRVRLLRIGVGEPEPVEDPGPEVLQHDVGVADQLQRRLPAVVRLQVECDAALVPVERRETDAEPVRTVRVADERRPLPQPVALPRAFHLHDIGAQVC